MAAGVRTWEGVVAELTERPGQARGDGFAITEYPDVPRVIADLDALIAQPIRRLRRDALQGYLDGHFEQKCAASKTMTAEAAHYIPGGVQHNLAFNLPFPLVVTKASGCHLTDLDGNQYLDFLQAGGPTVLGSNPPEVLEQVIDVLRTCGPSTGLFHEFELKLARFIADHMPAVPMFRMLGSGTEGCMAAIRVARLATGRRNVVKMGGAYHGWSDQLAYGLRLPGTRHHEAKGVPRYVFRHTQEFFPGDLEALERTLRLNRARAAPRPSSSSPSARRAARARCPWTSTRACASCATGSAPCSCSTRW